MCVCVFFEKIVKNANFGGEGDRICKQEETDYRIYWWIFNMLRITNKNVIKSWQQDVGAAGDNAWKDLEVMIC